MDFGENKQEQQQLESVGRGHVREGERKVDLVEIGRGEGMSGEERFLEALIRQ